MATVLEQTREATCPICGRTRRLSGRHARRSPICSLCRNPAKIKKPTDGDRRFWLERFSDEEIIDMAFWMFDQEGDIAAVRSWRELLCRKEIALTS